MRAMRALSQSILSTGINLPSQLDLARWQGKTMENGEHAKECKMQQKLDDGWPESEKDVFQAALSMVVVKNSR